MFDDRPNKKSCEEGVLLLQEMNTETFFLSDFSFNLKDKYFLHQLKQAIAALYWAFTTISSVGLGDYNAKSDAERLLCAFIFLFGVSIQSFIMGSFISILERVQTVDVDIGEGDKLTKFIKTLQRFNKGKPINDKFKLKLERYFDYRWENHKNLDDSGLLELLPIEIENSLMLSYQFSGFVWTFSKFFKIEKQFKLSSEFGKRKFFTWDDGEYRDFMTHVIHNLEPF